MLCTRPHHHSFSPLNVARHLACGSALFLAATSAAGQDSLFSWNGLHAGDQWGSTVAVIGDVNGDGRRDVAVGSPMADHQIPPPFGSLLQNVGVVHIYSGSTGGLIRTLLGSLTNGEEYGASICDAGDVNGDGFDDVLVGIPRATGPAVNGGIVELCSGADGSVLRTFYGLQTDARFGQAIAAGDMDGDGIYEVVIGSPDYDLDDPFGGPFQEGYIHVYRCSDGALVMKQAGTTYSSAPFATYTRGAWGRSVAYVGDSDGDGRGEIAVGAPTSHFSGIFGTTFNHGLLVRIEPVTGQIILHHGGLEGDLLGAAIDGLGDPDGDGKSDLIVGLPGAGSYGAVHVYSGLTQRLSFTGLSSRPIGWAVAAAHDVTGDGLPDVLIGSPLADTGTFPLIKSDVGVVQLHSGVDGTLVRSYVGANAGDHFGDNVAAGDLEGLGLDEVVIAAPRADIGGTNSGTVTTYEGEDCPAPASWSLYGQGLAGTNGVPGFSGLGTPAIAHTFQLTVLNSLGQNTTAYILLGIQQLNAPFKGGKLLVDPLLFLTIALPSAGSFVALPFPADPTFCGVVLYAQVAEVDPGAIAGISLTRGMAMTIGD